MAQKVVGYVKLQIPAGKATPAPPVGPALGQQDVYKRQIYSSGYKIYTLQDSKLQSIAESVFENSDLVEYTDDYGKPLQAAITLVDNSTGNVVAMVGGLGAKTVDRGWNWATEPRQCGSATKPISDYAPALDLSLIHISSR